MQNVSHVTITVETEVCNENWVFFTSKVDPLMFFDKEGDGFTEEKTAFKMQHVYICMRSQSLQLCPTLCDPHELQPARLLCLWNSAGKNTGVGGHILLQGIFPTQGLNPRLLNCRWIFYC